MGVSHGWKKLSFPPLQRCAPIFSSHRRTRTGYHVACVSNLDKKQIGLCSFRFHQGRHGNYEWQASVVDGSRWVGARCSTHKDVDTISLNIWDLALNCTLKVPVVPVLSASLHSLRAPEEHRGSQVLDVTPGDPLRARFPDKLCSMEMAPVSQVSPFRPISSRAAQTRIFITSRRGVSVVSLDSFGFQFPLGASLSLAPHRAVLCRTRGAQTRLRDESFQSEGLAVCSAI